MPVQITEQSSFHTGSIYHGGRGGAGNYRKLSTAEIAARESTLPVPIPTSNSRIFFGGRGGAGNVHPASERAMFSFDEELERDRLIHEHHAPVYSIGRGGKGNLVSCDDLATRSLYSTSPQSTHEHSASSSPRNSTSSNGTSMYDRFSAASIKSNADRFWDRVRRV